MKAPGDNLGGPGERQKGPRVFGVGFHKTGTTSLALALEHLGYRVCHGAGPVRDAMGHHTMMRRLRAGEPDTILDVAGAFDGLADNPWYLLVRELDARFPGSRFIMTTRDEDHWLQSALRYFGRSESDFRRWIYGEASPVGHESLYLDRYRRHEEEVQAHFSRRPGDLLVVDWEAGDGWVELCEFLGRPVPDRPFPWVNRTRGRSLLRLLARALPWGRKPGGPEVPPPQTPSQ